MYMSRYTWRCKKGKLQGTCNSQGTCTLTYVIIGSCKFRCEKGLFKKLWVPPAPSDAGSCIGSCLDYLVNVKKLKVRIPPNPFLGPSFTDNEIQSVLNKNRTSYLRESTC